MTIREDVHAIIQDGDYASEAAQQGITVEQEMVERATIQAMAQDYAIRGIEGYLLPDAHEDLDLLYGTSESAEELFDRTEQLS